MESLVSFVKRSVAEAETPLHAAHIFRDGLIKFICDVADNGCYALPTPMGEPTCIDFKMNGASFQIQMFSVEEENFAATFRRKP